MRRILSVVVVLTFVGLLFAQEAGHRYASAIGESLTRQDTLPEGGATAREPQRRRVDFMADMVKPYQYGTDSIVYFVGNFAAHHNGAVISCDSAVRFADTRWGFYGRVLINQDSIYIYGDSALYNGDASVAEIYAPIIKVVDGDALLYTYNFSFNTEERLGRYTGGGVLVHDDNIIESQRGYYDANAHDIICVDEVELHGADYDMKSDSVIYNTDTEFAQFFTQSEIWNKDGDYLAADAGYYDRSRELYMVTRNGYILSAEQEMWGDTLEYYRADEHVIARGNIQMDDFKNKMLAFGDYAEYWSDQGNAILTRNPSTISYDTSQSDSVFMRADTMHLLTIYPYAEQSDAPEPSDKTDEVGDLPQAVTPNEGGQASIQPSEQAGAPDSTAANRPTSLPDRGAGRIVAQTGNPSQERVVQNAAETLSTQQNAAQEQTSQATRSQGQTAQEGAAQEQTEQAQDSQNQASLNTVTENSQDSAATTVGTPVSEPTDAENAAEPTLAQDSTAMDSLVQDSLNLTPKQQQELAARQAKEAARKAKESAKRAKAAERKAKLDSIGKQRVAKVAAQLDKQREKDLERMAKDSVRRAELRAKLVAKGRDVSALDVQDSLAAIRSARIRGQYEPKAADSVAAPSHPAAPAAEEAATQQEKADSLPPDSMYRLIKAYRNVKLFRKDAQMVCDSLTSSSLDSVVHLYIDPVLWNGSNQLASQFVDLYSKNQQLTRAEFLGNPIMVSMIDTTYYNQVTGKKMISLFRDNDIYRNDVDGNVQTIYFNREDEKTTLVTEMIYLESASASFYIENRELVGVTYRNNVPITMYPIDQIPPTQAMRLPNFKWVPERRPSLEDVFDRTIRPTRRDVRVDEHRPTFDIVERMDRRKEDLMRRGEWYDREDELTPEVIEWRDSRER